MCIKHIHIVKLCLISFLSFFLINVLLILGLCFKHFMLSFVLMFNLFRKNKGEKSIFMNLVGWFWNFRMTHWNQQKKKLRMILRVAKFEFISLIYRAIFWNLSSSANQSWDIRSQNLTHSQRFQFGYRDRLTHSFLCEWFHKLLNPVELALPDYMY